MADWGMSVKRQDISKDVEDCDPKELVFSSKFPCAKILQTGKEVASGGATNVNFSATVSFPIHILGFLYDSADSEYHAVNLEFDTSKVYFPGGEAAGSYYYYFVCYA